MIKWTLFASFLALFLLLSAQDNGPRKVRLPEALEEVSGLYVQSTDSLWWHNDSGGDAALFLTNRKGELQSQVPLPGTSNTDWEDITHDTNGRVYVGDFGDNRRRRAESYVYRYDPRNGEVVQTRFQYPDGAKYDVEAMLWYQDSLHLFTKSRIRRAELPTYHFVLPASPGKQEAVLRDSLLLRKRAVTAAAVDHESGRMVLLAYYYTKRLGFLPYSAANVYCFEPSAGGRWLSGAYHSRRISWLVATQYESVDFLRPERLLVASEKTLFIKAKAKRVRWK